MWTNMLPLSGMIFAWFQSLSRDSVHVDIGDCIADIWLSNGFNPSVGIPSMWTAKPTTDADAVYMFQSLSRDSVHVDRGGRGLSRGTRVVSIPQSGFRPCGRYYPPPPPPPPPSFNPSVGIPSMWTCRGPRRRELRFDGFNPSVGIPSMWTDLAASIKTSADLFQSLSRDSVHVDR